MYQKLYLKSLKQNKTKQWTWIRNNQARPDLRISLDRAITGVLFMTLRFQPPPPPPPAGAIFPRELEVHAGYKFAGKQGHIPIMTSPYLETHTIKSVRGNIVA